MTDLSSDQLSALKIMTEKYAEYSPDDDNFRANEATILRYLRARSFNVEKACTWTIFKCDVK